MDSRIRAAESLILAYHVDSTPTLIVNGKYRVTGVSAGNLERMITIARWLIARETAAAAKKSAGMNPTRTNPTGAGTGR